MQVLLKLKIESLGLKTDNGFSTKSDGMNRFYNKTIAQTRGILL